MNWNRRRLTAARSLPRDILHISRSVPSARIETTFALSNVARLRDQCQPRISWATLFLKAYALTAAQQSWLRQSYCRWPLPHLYQHPRSVAMCAIAREHSDEPWLCWGRFLEPSEHSLLELQSRLTRYQTQPIPLVFKRQFRFSRCPTIVRRACWWLLLNTSGRLRERKLGTFSLSTLAGQGVINRDHPSILTTSISYGPVDAAGNCVVTLIYDHRVFDGLRAACSLRKLESILREDIAAELGRLAATRMVA